MIDGVRRVNLVKNVLNLFISDFKISANFIPYIYSHFGDFSNNNIDINTANKSQYVLKYKIKSSIKVCLYLLNFIKCSNSQRYLTKVILSHLIKSILFLFIMQ